MYIEKKFKFYAAHRNIHLNDKCSNLHGHRYGVVCRINVGDIKDDGITMVFDAIEKCIDPIIKEYDHSMLLDVNDPDRAALQSLSTHDGRPNKCVLLPCPSSAENLAAILFKQVHDTGLQIEELHLQETDTSIVIYTLADHLKRNATEYN